MGKIGYIRVSTEHQETARQEAIMEQYQVDKVFAEKISGKSADRPELKAMLDYTVRVTHCTLRASAVSDVLPVTCLT